MPSGATLTKNSQPLQRHLCPSVYWCNLNLAQKKGLPIKHDHTQTFSTTHCRFVLRKFFSVCKKTKEELYHKVNLSPRLPRVFLKPNSQSGPQDQHEQEAIKSPDRQSVSGSYGETRSVNVDQRIPCIPILQSNNKTRIARKRLKS